MKWTLGVAYVVLLASQLGAQIRRSAAELRAIRVTGDGDEVRVFLMKFSSP
jgi:hypothetical protein